MPRPKNPAAYPTVYSELIEIVSSSGEDFRHRCASNKEAMHLRFSFYDFIKACKKSHFQRDRDLAEMAAGLMFKVSGQDLIVCSRDMQEGAISLQSSLQDYQASNELPSVTSHQPPAPATSHPPMTKPNVPTQDQLLEQYMKGKK